MLNLNLRGGKLQQHLKEICEFAVVIQLWLGKRAPHGVQVFFPGLNKPLQGCPSFVAEHKKEDSPLLLWVRCKKLQIDLQKTEMRVKK